MSAYEYLLKYREAAKTTRERLWAEDKMCMIYTMCGDYATAKAFMKRICQESKDHFGEDDIMYVHAVTNLGNIAREAGQIEEALPYYDHAIELRKKTGHDAENTLTCLVLAGQISNDLKKYEKAELYYTEAIPLAELKESKDARFTAQLTGS
jgi:tetratricopeptide (TPR) repeat protein